MNIPITKTLMDQEELELIQRPIESGWLVQGKYVQEFERLFCEYTRAPYSKAATSCTTAMHLALEMFEWNPGDKIVVPAFTWIATANVVEYCNATPVFCDIDPETFNLDVDKFEAILKEDTKVKGVIPVHLFGLCADMPRIMELARKYELKVVEDSACGLGSWIGEQHSGTFGDAGCFSFHPRKVVTTGEGGMVTTCKSNYDKLISSLRDHGASKTDLQRHNEKDSFHLPAFSLRGYNYRMTDIQGALGVAQMGKLETILSTRRKVASQYDEALKELKALKSPHVPQNYVHGYQSYVCWFLGDSDFSQLKDISLVDKLHAQRNEFMSLLENEGIATRQGTHAVHNLEYYKKKYSIKTEDFPFSYAADRLSVALPCFGTLSNEEFDFVIKSIRSALEKVGY